MTIRRIRQAVKSPSHSGVAGRSANRTGLRVRLWGIYADPDRCADAGDRRIDFETDVDWRENGRMLRTSFPVNIRTDQVHCEIQFGALSRPTHRNTMWDFAKDEICAHQWIDLSEPDYGVAPLNDCKYGHRAIHNVLDLHLLRGSSYPDPNADRAEHRFTYSVYPHQGTMCKPKSIDAAMS